jgi:GDP-4-dehydro-6-deoxy-D-mannose reductase
MSKSVLITGGTGFVGSHLVEYYLNNTDYSVFTICRHRSPLKYLKAVINSPRLTMVPADINDLNSIINVLKYCKFDIIHHLAAQSYVPDSWVMGNKTLQTNIEGTFNILQAVRNVYTHYDYPIVHLAGSSEEYGMVYPEEVPIKETNSLRPLSPYGVSKIATENLGYQMHHSYGIPIIVTRAFNHSGARRGENFITSNFTKQVAEQLVAMRIAGINKSIVLEVGNLDSVRDYTNVKDMVRAYAMGVELLAKKDTEKYYVVNVAYGKGYSGYELVGAIKEAVGNVDIITTPKLDRMRPSDVPILIGDSTLFRQLTGWEPKISFEETVKELLDYWLNELKQ